MNIKRAKQEIKDAIEAYLLKDEYGAYVIPQIRQRPVLLLGAPGIGKTQIMEQIAKECGGDDVAAWKMAAINELADTNTI